MITRWCLRFVAALALGLTACGSGDPEPRRESTAPPASTPPPVAQPAQKPTTPPEPAPTPAQSRGRAATKVAYAGELPSLPVTSFPAARPPEVVNAAYEFAARRPDVLRYVPCFCGCERNGHVHNEHCFVASREADGKPRWDAHGMSWGICLDVARDAMQMHNAGVDLATIRRTIESKYRTASGNITPTPPVPTK